MKKKTALNFVAWLMDNCELSEDNTLWSYDGEDYTNGRLYKIFLQNRCSICGQGFDRTGKCPSEVHQN